MSQGRGVVVIGVPDLISPSYFPAIAAVELGYFRARDVDATIELVFPVTTTYERLRSGDLHFVAGAAHAALYAFPRWEGVRLVAALSQRMYWFLVVRSDLAVDRGDLGALRGLRIGAAPGPADGLRRMLAAVDIDPDRDVAIGPVPTANDGNVSFGMAAADALRRGIVDGFWANGMGAEVAVREGTGTILLDVRRDDAPGGAGSYTFPALATTVSVLEEDAALVSAAVAALVEAQHTLAAEPTLAGDAVADVFPEYERSLIGGLVARDAPYYNPRIDPDAVRALNTFARSVGLLGGEDVPYDLVVAADSRSEWER